MSKEYSDLLKHPNWQKKRLEILERAGFKCERCGSGEKTLHVHHRRYQWGKKPWECSNWLLQSLCEECHEDATVVQRKLKDAFNEVLEYCNPAEMWSAIGFLQGLVCGAVGQLHMPVTMTQQAVAAGQALGAPRARTFMSFRGSQETGWLIDTGWLDDVHAAEFAHSKAVEPEATAEGTDTGDA